MKGKHTKRLSLNKVYLGDCKKVLKRFPDKYVNLIFTSPPYGNRRQNSYDSVSPRKYVDWFLPISKELKRVLKHNGSFILNIKENSENGEKQTYVIELILEMRKQGWLWTEEYIWHKKNAFPGKWPNRFRDSWERCLHFTKKKKFKMYQEAVKVSIGDWAKGRLNNLSAHDKIRNMSKSESGLGRNLQNWVRRRKAYPSNVLHLPTVCYNKNHSAAFPETLPNWFIRLFTKKGDIVLDPFIGSGTTAVAALKLDRKFLGIEINKEYYKNVIKTIKMQLEKL